MKNFNNVKKHFGKRCTALGAAACLGAGILFTGLNPIFANAEYADCDYYHDHKTVVGYTTGADYEVGAKFGSNTAFEAPKLPYGEEIVVDGFKDAIWDEYDDYAIKTLTGTDYYNNWRNSDVTGLVQYIWDDGCLYVWVEIYESTVNIGRSGANAWGDSKGDNLEFYLDTLHTDELVDSNFADGLYAWDGCDGAAYRGGSYDYKTEPNNNNSPKVNKENETTAGMALDGGNYEDASVGKYRISGGANQTTGEYDYQDNKINSYVNVSGNKDAFGNLTDRRGCGDGNRVEWAPFTYLSSWEQWDGDSNFTSAYIFEDWDISVPYNRGLTTNLDMAEQEYNSLKNEVGGGKNAIGFTFEAMFEFKSELYEPTDGSIIGVGISYEDWKSDDNGWLGGYRATFGLENNGSCSYDYVRVAPLNLSHLVLLPGEDTSGGSTSQNYKVSFLDGQKEAYSYSGKKGDVVPTPPNPSKPGYKFLGWKGFSEGYTITGNKTFRAQWEAVLDELPEYPSDVQADDNYQNLNSNDKVAVYEGEKTTASIVVDGVPDYAYGEAVAIPIGSYCSGDTEVYGVAYVLFDNNFIYAFVTVYDSEVVTDGPTGNEGQGVGYEATWDNVALYLDTYNKATKLNQGYGGDYRGDAQCEGRFRLNAGGDHIVPAYHMYDPWMLSDTNVLKEGASRVIDGVGYTAEFKIAVSSYNANIAVDKQIAFTIIITDGDGTEVFGKNAAGENQQMADWELGAFCKLDLVDNNETVDEPITTTYPNYVGGTNNNPDNGSNGGDGSNKDNGGKKGCKSSLEFSSAITLVLALGVIVFALRKKFKAE